MSRPATSQAMIRRESCRETSPILHHPRASSAGFDKEAGRQHSEGARRTLHQGETRKTTTPSPTPSGRFKARLTKRSKQGRLWWSFLSCERTAHTQMQMRRHSRPRRGARPQPPLQMPVLLQYISAWYRSPSELSSVRLRLRDYRLGAGFVLFLCDLPACGHLHQLTV